VILPTLAFSSRIGTCCVLPHPSSGAKVRLKSPKVSFSSKHSGSYTADTSHEANTANDSSDLKKDIKARHDGQKHYGYDVWFAGHRNGANGVENPYTVDIHGMLKRIRCIIILIGG
jgi:hypothetical protein